MEDVDQFDNFAKCLHHAFMALRLGARHEFAIESEDVEHFFNCKQLHRFTIGQAQRFNQSVLWDLLQITNVDQCVAKCCAHLAADEFNVLRRDVFHPVDNGEANGTPLSVERNEQQSCRTSCDLSCILFIVFHIGDVRILRVDAHSCGETSCIEQ